MNLSTFRKGFRFRLRAWGYGAADTPLFEEVTRVTARGVYYRGVYADGSKGGSRVADASWLAERATPFGH